MTTSQLNHRSENNLDQFWSGYCPECELQGKRSRMRLNVSDFYECEESHLQMVLTAPNLLATILKFRGTGKFRQLPQYADEAERNELFCRQTLGDYPFTNNDLFGGSGEISRYIELEVK